MNLKIYFLFCFFACVGLFASENYRTNNEGQDLNLCQKAAKKGDPIAQYKLGEMYHKGKGCEQNYGKAFEWYKKAAEQGDEAAQYWLGDMYYNGVGIEKNNREYKWYKKAAEQGDEITQKIVKDLKFFYEK